MTIGQDDFVVPKNKIKKPKFNYIGDDFSISYSVETITAKVEAVSSDGGHEYIVYSDDGFVLEYSDCGYGECARALRDGLTALLERY